MTVLERLYTREDRAESLYQYLVVEVPPDAASLTVTLDYDHTEAVVDLGLIGPDRFCGWSGSERSTVTVTRDWATPGYVPGALAGGWQVILGLHRIAPGGTAVSLDVDTTFTPPPPTPAPPPPRPERPPRRDLPAMPGYRWFAGDFHSHTVHSDGSLEIAELAVLAASRGLDLLAVTDHNTVSHHALLAAAGEHAGILLLPGQEVTTDSGHANCFGALPWIDFREPADHWRAETERRGGVMAVNHPWAGDCAWRLPLSEPATHVEMWHSTWDQSHPLPLSGWSAFGAYPIGGSDFHRLESGVLPGNPTTWVQCADLTIEGVLDGLRNGRTAVSALPGGPVLLREGTDHVAIDADGCNYVASDGSTTPVRGGLWHMAGDGPAYLAADGRAVAFAR